MKYRYKIDTPFGSKGEIAPTAPSGNYYFGGIYYDPKQYPDLFEPIEEEKPKRWGLAFHLLPNNRTSMLLGPITEDHLKLYHRDDARLIFPARFDDDGYLIIPEDK